MTCHPHLTNEKTKDYNDVNIKRIFKNHLSTYYNAMNYFKSFT